MNTIVQCDFDGTITEEDASFYLLDEFAQGDWRSLLDDYKSGRITVGEFNTRSFSMIKEDEKTLLRSVEKNVRVRPGFRRLVDFSVSRGFRFVIVSNGLEFYINAVLGALGLGDIQVCAATNVFSANGVRVQYIGPDGTVLQDGFKEAYIRMYLKEGYRVIYVGNGISDTYAARHAHKVFATGDLLDYYTGHGLSCESFSDLNDVADALSRL